MISSNCIRGTSNLDMKSSGCARTPGISNRWQGNGSAWSRTVRLFTNLMIPLEERAPLVQTPPLFRSGFIALLGRPNVGKSTLLNRMLKQKLAIVSDKPQTTRTKILGIKHLTGAQLIFLDTPGIHKPKFALNRTMVK